VIHKIKAWLSNNSDFVQAFAAIIQTVIAAAMLVTIFQTARTLSITQRQLESSIEPVLDMDMFGSTLQLVNSGSIEIRKLEQLAIIAGDFDLDTESIGSYKVIRGRQTLDIITI
jgi:peroxiredoxin family protein